MEMNWELQGRRYLGFQFAGNAWMRIYSFLLSLLVAFLAGCNPGQKGEPSDELVQGMLEGTYALKGTLNSRYVLSIVIDHKNNRETHCTGVLIAPKLALTAAHCFQEYQKTNEIKIRSLDGLELVEERIGTEKFLHDEYSPDVRYDADGSTNRQDVIRRMKDVAVIRFSSEFGDFVRIPEIDFSGKYLVAGTSLEVNGYGNIDRKGSQGSKEILRFTNLMISGVAFKGLNLILTDPRKASLFSPIAGGDSGGPVFYLDPKTNQRTLVAINRNHTSLGDNDEDIVISGHTTIKGVATWLRQFVPENSSLAPKP